MSLMSFPFSAVQLRPVVRAARSPDQPLSFRTRALVMVGLSVFTWGVVGCAVVVARALIGA